ncbi:MAG: serine/threonine protein phosphatase [Chitinophagales bacterium]|nr:serine/threonine protein phosphatase [Chitinophagales bacterium]
MSTFVISNIHGNNARFQSILKKAKFTKTDTLMILGDLIDFGHDSKGVLDSIFLLKKHGFKVICIRGDHEQILLDTLDGKYSKNFWLSLGGQKTLESFNVKDVTHIPNPYIEFLKSLPLFHITEHYYFVHAGIDMTANMPLKDSKSLLTLTNWQEKYVEGWLGESKIIHGHTPESQTEILKQIEKGYNVIGIDNGNQVRKELGFGKLCIFNLDENTCIFEG